MVACLSGLDEWLAAAKLHGDTTFEEPNVPHSCRAQKSNSSQIYLVLLVWDPSQDKANQRCCCWARRAVSASVSVRQGILFFPQVTRRFSSEVEESSEKQTPRNHLIKIEWLPVVSPLPLPLLPFPFLFLLLVSRAPKRGGESREFLRESSPSWYLLSDNSPKSPFFLFVLNYHLAPHDAFAALSTAFPDENDLSSTECLAHWLACKNTSSNYTRLYVLLYSHLALFCLLLFPPDACGPLFSNMLIRLSSCSSKRMYRGISPLRSASRTTVPDFDGIRFSPANSTRHLDITYHSPQTSYEDISVPGTLATSYNVVSVLSSLSVLISSLVSGKDHSPSSNDPGGKTRGQVIRYSEKAFYRGSQRFQSLILTAPPHLPENMNRIEYDVNLYAKLRMSSSTSGELQVRIFLTITTSIESPMSFPLSSSTRRKLACRGQSLHVDGRIAAIAEKLRTEANIVEPKLALIHEGVNELKMANKALEEKNIKLEIDVAGKTTLIIQLEDALHKIKIRAREAEKGKYLTKKKVAELASWVQEANLEKFRLEEEFEKALAQERAGSQKIEHGLEARFDYVDWERAENANRFPDVGEQDQKDEGVSGISYQSSWVAESLVRPYDSMTHSNWHNNFRFASGTYSLGLHLNRPNNKTNHFHSLSGSPPKILAHQTERNRIFSPLTLPYFVRHKNHPRYCLKTKSKVVPMHTNPLSPLSYHDPHSFHSLTAQTAALNSTSTTSPP
ncbi:uncharacterized protein BDR25DRAFT_355067 [Lindgomyces ingoldianus]|uniref:Uncharacterized protein n=1 Tax=Lindgomyces ingoldianus TaxID=673940 RepID=A0ACB6QVN6_9PLEO|nr:uncharacterized protein BDR25DRAFT_355067 [Lindgomyces ingoldianus]KAF2470575.1 hypothetical protein BDR25DRAFT_355067 [Lindgomyces ingoldianus]